MTGLNLRNIDLNLLVAFDALMVEGHVSRAASRVGVSQPAMSRSLKLLRELFSDRLFVRTNHGMIATPVAQELGRQLEPGLAIIAAAIGMHSEFVPESAQRRFQLAMPDLASFLLLPEIMKAMRAKAPNCEVSVVNGGNKEVLERVESGQVDFGFGTFDHLPDCLRNTNVSTLREVCIADPQNRHLSDGAMPLERFLSLPHVEVDLPGDHGTPVDLMLETLGHTRRSVVRVPNFLSVPRLILGTDLIAVVPESLLDCLPEGTRLHRYPVPLPLEPVMGRMVWHRRFDQDAGHEWLRTLISQIAAGLNR